MVLGGGGVYRRIAATLIVPIAALLLARVPVPGVEISLFEKAMGPDPALIGIGLSGVASVHVGGVARRGVGARHPALAGAAPGRMRGISAFPRGRHYRTLWNFTAPFVPVDILVPAGDAAAAETILRAQFGGDESPDPATDAPETESR